MTSGPTFFTSAQRFRAWLAKHHARADALEVGFYKVGSGRGGLTYQEALDEALCFGWIDGVRHTRDDASYTIRFSPRKPGSAWSLVNTRRAKALQAAGRMTEAGLAAFRRRDPAKTRALYSREARERPLDPAYQRRLEANARAWAHFRSFPPWYRKLSTFWVMSAKQEATRERRLAKLIEWSARGEIIPPFGTAKK